MFILEVGYSWGGYEIFSDEKEDVSVGKSGKKD